MNPPETATTKPEAKKVNVAAKSGKAAAAQPRVAEEAHAAWARIDQAKRTRRDQARIDKWIRDRLVDWRDSCWRCRRLIVPGQPWTVVAGDEVVVRFHQHCHDDWRAQQELAARQALRLEHATKETTSP
jgi:hypothetical protein